MQILDGHYLQQVYTGDMMGQLFTGIKLLEYDNRSGKVSLDSMSTGIFYFVGPASADGKTISQECLYDDRVKGPASGAA